AMPGSTTSESTGMSSASSTSVSSGGSAATRGRSGAGRIGGGVGWGGFLSMAKAQSEFDTLRSIAALAILAKMLAAGGQQVRRLVDDLDDAAEALRIGRQLGVQVDQQPLDMDRLLVD